MFLFLTIILSSADAITLNGSAEYAVPGTDFTLSCDVPEEVHNVEFFRRPEVKTAVGVVILAGSDRCYNRFLPNPCTTNTCACVTSGGRLGRVFQWTIQPQTGDHGSLWFCRAFRLSDQTRRNSRNYRLRIAAGPGNSMSLSPPNSAYTRTEGDTLPDITCTADCRPGCTFVWTRPDNTNITASPVLSLGQLERSEHGTYICTARNKVGELSISVNVTILHLPYIVISPSTNPFIVAEGQTGVTLQCAVTLTNPHVTSISWTKDSTKVSSTGIYNLPIITPGHTGVYKCSASNSIGTTTANINVEVSTDTVSPTTQETVSSTSIVLTVVGVVLIVVALIGFGVSVVVYRKGRLLCRSARQQEMIQQQVEFSNVLHVQDDTTAGRTGDRPHYQDLDLKDIGKPSYYDSTTGFDTGKNNAERGYYQEVDVSYTETPSTYENTVGVDTGVGHDGSRRKSTALYSNT